VDMMYSLCQLKVEVAVCVVVAVAEFGFLLALQGELGM